MQYQIGKRISAVSSRGWLKDGFKALLASRCLLSLTIGFQILSGIHAGAPFGLSTCTLSPVNRCTFLVPRSRSRISVWPRLAAFSAAWRGDLPVKTPISLPSKSRSAKFLISFSTIFLSPTLKIDML